MTAYIIYQIIRIYANQFFDFVKRMSPKIFKYKKNLRSCLSQKPDHLIKGKVTLANLHITNSISTYFDPAIAIINSVIKSIPETIRVPFISSKMSEDNTIM